MPGNGEDKNVNKAEIHQQKDLAGRPLRAALVWGLPVALLFLASPLAAFWKTIVWTTAIGWMGAACLVNASRCGRRHCFITGPFFLLIALLAALHGSGAAPLGPNGWRWLGAALLGGGAALIFLPDWIWGKYTGRK